MIEVGESSGDLPQMLEDVAEFYDQEVENRLTLLTTMIEPVLMLNGHRHCGDRGRSVSSDIRNGGAPQMTSFRRKGSARSSFQGAYHAGAESARSWRGARKPGKTHRRAFGCRRDHHREVLAQALAEQRDLRYLDLAEFRINPAFFEKIPVELIAAVPIRSGRRDGRRRHRRGHDRPEQHPAIDELEMILDAGGRLRQHHLGHHGGGQAERHLRAGAPHRVGRLQLNIVKEQENGEESCRWRASTRTKAPSSSSCTPRSSTPSSGAPATFILNRPTRTADQVPHRRRTLPRHRAHRHQVPQRHRIAHQGHERPRHRPNAACPQDGRFKIRTGGKTIDFRVSILPSAFGEDVSSASWTRNRLRRQYPQLDSVGFDDNDLRRFRKSIREPYGMVLVTGPTGSGKTTTLYAALTEINTGEDKFITIEDPVEYSSGA